MAGVDGTTWGPAEVLPGARPLVVGRSPEADVVLAHPGVSRRHAELALDGRGMVVRDLGSRAGTRVNWKKVGECVLAEGDRVDFGAVAYSVKGRSLVRVDRETRGLELEATDLVVERGGRRLLSGVRVAVKPGHFVAVLGASGSGKSTLLKCFAGVLFPSAGRLRIDGHLELPDDLDYYRTAVGYVPQDDVAYDRLTVRENLTFAAELRLPDHTSPERASLVEAVLGHLGLHEHADKEARILSGGQRKRLNVAFEMLARPRGLFLDEPTSGLDLAAERRLMHLLKGLASRGTTVVCVTHVLENLDLVDQVIVVAAQTVLSSGPPGLLLKRFGVGDRAELYERLAEASPDRRRAASSEEDSRVDRVLAGVGLVEVRKPAAPAIPQKLDLPHQISVLVRRGVLLLGRDRLLLALLIGQPLGIGLLINLSQINPDGLKPFFLFAAVTAIWLGLNNTAREAVRERRIYSRERLVGVPPDGYLAAKAVLFAGVGLSQMVLLVGILVWANLLPPAIAREDLAPWPGWYLVLVLWATYLAGMLLGLLVSTLATTQEAAMAVLPLIVLPQLLLSGVASGLHAETTRTGAFGPLVELAEKARDGEGRGLKGWVLEAASLATYSRPAVTLLSEAGESEARRLLVRGIDWIHLAVLGSLTALGLVVTFQRREGSWLEQS